MSPESKSKLPMCGTRAENALAENAENVRFMSGQMCKMAKAGRNMLSSQKRLLNQSIVPMDIFLGLRMTSN